MEHNTGLEKRKTHNYGLQRKNKNTYDVSPWLIVGGAALVLGTAIFLKNLPDLKRYIKISRM